MNYNIIHKDKDIITPGQEDSEDRRKMSEAEGMERGV